MAKRAARASALRTALRTVLAPTLLAALCTVAEAQGFAGMGSDAAGFAQPRRGAALEFPRDHGPHPDFRIEWWYATATLEDSGGREFGVQWTLFRTALAPQESGVGTSGEYGEGESRSAWRDPQVWFAHAAVTSSGEHFYAERFARGATGQAGAVAEPFSAWLDDWTMEGEPGRGLDRLRVFAREPEFGFDLALESSGPVVLHGDGGYSVKSPLGQASYYYSLPFLEASGTLRLPEGEVAVTGNAWIDREWSSQPLAPDQDGWDWFSLRFDDGSRLMAFQVRGRDGGFAPGTWIRADGAARAIPDGEIELVPVEVARVAGREIPVCWRIRHAAESLDVEVAALNPQAWNALSIPYWEGPVRVSGSHSGNGFLEMTGYGGER